VTTLRAAGVHAGYGRRQVLRGIDLTLAGGDLLALIGPNGSGKTTLLRALAGTLRPRSGAVLLDGTPIGALDARARARRISVVPQTYTTPFAFTAREVVMLGRSPYVDAFGRPSARDRAAVDRALELTECTRLADRSLSELSGGERQRALIAMALAQEGDVLLLDEPTVHLDPAHQRATLELIRRLARQRSVAALAVLHDLNLASALADRVVVMGDGRVVADGPPLEVVSAAMVANVFGPGLVVGTQAGVPFVLPERPA
jgi:iron complex transport system ATP-binding protein